MAILDWYSRFVLAWESSHTLDAGFCLAALATVLARSRPETFNPYQGVQCTSQASTNRLEAAGIQISWDGRGRALDNGFVQRLWRAVKWEMVSSRPHSAVSPCPCSGFPDGCMAESVHGRKILEFHRLGGILPESGLKCSLCLQAEGPAIWSRAAENLSIPGRSWIHRDSKAILQERCHANCGMWDRV